MENTSSVLNKTTAKESFTPVQRLWRLLQPEVKEIRDIYIYAAFYGLIGLSLPLGIQAIINLIQGGQVNSAWIILVIIVTVGYGASGLMQIAQLRITENIQQKIFTRSAFELAVRIPRIKLEELYNHYPPELMNRFFDTLTVQKSLSKILIDFSTAGLQIIFGLILLSIYHPFFILFSVLIVVVSFAILRTTAGRGLVSSLKESKNKYRVAHWLEEVARTSTTFKLAGETDLHLKRTNNTVNDYLTTRESHFKVLMQQYSLLVILKVVIAAVYLAIGGVLVMDQRMNLGQFVAAELVVLLIISSIEKIILSMETVYDMLTALEKIGQVTDLELEQDGMTRPVDRGKHGYEVDMVNLSFSYPGNKEPTIRNLSLRVNAGEKVLLTGKTGSGKSTLLHLIAGLYEPQKGVIVFDGVPIKGLVRDALRTEIGSCLNNEDLFEGTIYDNIAMSRPGVLPADVRWAVDACGLSSFVRGLNEGLETFVAPQGKKLSRGLIQKVILARCVVNRPSLILLEDALDRVDSEERKQILRRLSTDLGEPTIIAVTDDTELLGDPHTTIELVNGSVNIK